MLLYLNIYIIYSKYKFCVTIFTTIQKFEVSSFFLSFLKKLILLFSKDVLNG